MKTNLLDQFYTNHKIYDELIELIDKMLDLNTFDLIIEPAGECDNFIDALYKKGINVLKKVRASDVEPKCNKYIIKQIF